VKKYVVIAAIVALAIMLIIPVVAQAAVVGGKATGGIKFMQGDTQIQLDFVAMSSARGAKGVVEFKSSYGQSAMGRVTGYFQNADGTLAIFVGKATRVSGPGISDWKYFYVAVRDHGQGAAAQPDEGVVLLAGPDPYHVTDIPLGDFEGASGMQAFAGNVTIHK
jgi:hypothetical protein